MAGFQLTKQAVSDLTTIWNYTVMEWSESQAEKYYNLLLDTCASISENPKLGKSYEGIANKLLGLRIQKHIIFYRVLPNKPLEITRIL
jgi:toxin ParE1/3/4